MIKLITSFATLLLASSSISQISVTSTDFVSDSDTALVSTVVDFQNINYQSAGANQTWDFTNVLVDSQRIDTFSNVGNAGLVYQFVFNNSFLNPDYKASYYQKASTNAVPTGGIPIAIEDPISFEKISSSKFERVGLGINLNGAPVPIQADTIDVVYQLPMTYQDNWISNSYLFFDLNPAFDIKFKRHQNRTSEVDGYGTVITHYGNFQCIRVKSSLTYIDSLFFDLLGTGNGSWIGLPSQPEIQYRWIAKNQKIPVFSIDVANTFGTETITKVEFRDDLDVTSVQENYKTTFSVYPNPANDFLQLSQISEFDYIQISNISGQLVYNSNAASNYHKIDCSEWQKGVYIVKLSSSEKTSTKKIIII
jgi:hypothetical protein